MANYTILRIEKRKLNAVTKICNHHERLKEQYKSNPDIDSERTHLNYHLYEPKERYRAAVLDRIEEAGAKRRKDSVVLQDSIVTASPGWINNLSQQEQREFFERAYDFFTKTFGEENMISAVVHMDETNPHMHVCFVPITKDNRLSSKDIIGGPRGLVKLQDDFYSHMHERFPDLSRGLSRKITQRKHIPTEFYKNADNLMSHYEEIVKAINDIGVFKNGEKREAAITLLGRYAPEMAQMNRQLKMTDNYVTRLENAITDYKKSNANRNDIIYDQREEIEQLKDKVSELNFNQRKLQRVIDKIPPDVMEQMKKDERARRRAEREER